MKNKQFKKQLKDKKTTEKLSRFEWAGVDIARRHGIYVLFGGPREDRQWTLFSRKTGVELGTYFTKSGHYRFGTVKGDTSLPEVLMKVAACIDQDKPIEIPEGLRA